MLMIGAGAVAVLLLAACSSIQPSVGQYAIVTGHGNLSNQQVLQVVAPGQQVHLGSGTTTWYVPANVRNYVTAPQNGDRSNPQQEITGPGSSKEPGMADYTWTYIAWELNPRILISKPFAQAFLGFCLKYGCASQTAQNSASNESLAHSSAPGWNNMLAEVMPVAIDYATRDAIQNFQPNLWTDRNEWQSYGGQIQAALPGELDKLTGNSTGYFCGPGSTTSKCTPPQVLVTAVTPADQNVVTSYNQEVAAQYAQQAGAARLKAAQAVYGGDANYFLGMQDLISDCRNAKVTCNIVVGNPPSHP
jgi:hypothetical protein